MSFGEIGKSVNSKLRTPLNHLIWLHDYKTYGEKSYVFIDKDILHELYKSPISINDPMISGVAADYLMDTVGDISFISNIYGISEEDKSQFIGKTIDDLVEDITLLNIVAEYDILMNLFEGSVNFQKKIQNSSLIQTTSVSPVDNTISKTNVFTFEICSGVASANLYTLEGYGACTATYHGESTATTLWSAYTAETSAVSAKKLKLFKFCKNINMGSLSGGYRQDTAMYIKYIQLESVS